MMKFSVVIQTCMLLALTTTNIYSAASDPRCDTLSGVQKGSNSCFQKFFTYPHPEFPLSALRANQRTFAAYAACLREHPGQALVNKITIPAPACLHPTSTQSECKPFVTSYSYWFRGRLITCLKSNKSDVTCYATQEKDKDGNCLQWRLGGQYLEVLKKLYRAQK